MDFASIQNPLPETATSVLRSNLPMTSINNSVTQITNAIGSLGSLGSVYQTSVDLSEKNMATLISMGFANRTLNSRLLIKHNNNMDKVANLMFILLLSVNILLYGDSNFVSKGTAGFTRTSILRFESIFKETANNHIQSVI